MGSSPSQTSPLLPPSEEHWIRDSNHGNEAHCTVRVSLHGDASSGEISARKSDHDWSCLQPWAVSYSATLQMQNIQTAEIIGQSSHWP
jgi:hypothetical protein